MIANEFFSFPSVRYATWYDYPLILWMHTITAYSLSNEEFPRTYIPNVGLDFSLINAWNSKRDIVDSVYWNRRATYILFMSRLAFIYIDYEA